MGGQSSGTQAIANTTTTTPAPAYAGALNNSIKQIGNLANLTPLEQQGFLGLESGNVSGLLSGYLPQQQNVAQQLYSGGQNYAPIVNDAYNSYLQGVTPLANASLNPYETPGFSDAINTAKNDAFNTVASSYAAAGRDPSGAGSFPQTFERGFTQGAAPTIAAQYNTNVANRMAALSGMFGAGGTTAGILSGLQQTKFGNMLQGQPAAQGAQDVANSQYIQQLQAEAAKRGIPMEAYLAQAGIALPASQAFGTTTTTGTGNQTQQMSGAQQFALLGQGAGSILGQQKGILPLTNPGWSIFGKA